MSDYIRLLQGEGQSAPPFMVLTGTGQPFTKIGQAFIVSAMHAQMTHQHSQIITYIQKADI